MCYNQTGNIATLDGASLKLVDKFSYLGSSVSSTEKDIDTRLTKAWTAIDRLSIIWKSDLTDKMKRSFFQAAVVSILLYGCTTWTLTKRLERRLDGNYTRMLRAVLNKSWRQHPTRLQLYGHLPPITKTIQVRRTRHAGHCWRSKDELISDVLLWTPTHGCARVGRPARTYIQQLCEDTGCNPEDLPEAMNDREKWRETVRDIRAGGATWWWWWFVHCVFHPLLFSSFRSLCLFFTTFLCFCFSSSLLSVLQLLFFKHFFLSILKLMSAELRTRWYNPLHWGKPSPKNGCAVHGTHLHLIVRLKMGVLRMELNCAWWRGYNNENLLSMSDLLIATISRFTLAQSVNLLGSYGSNTAV